MILKAIKGLVTNQTTGLEPCEVIVRFSSDRLGETLSLEACGQMITVPFEALQKIIEKEREK